MPYPSEDCDVAGPDPEFPRVHQPPLRKKPVAAIAVTIVNVAMTIVNVAIIAQVSMAICASTASRRTEVVVSKVSARADRALM